MRILCFLVFGALLLPVVIAETATPNRPEKVTTVEPTTPHIVSSTPEQKFEDQQSQESEDSDKPRNVRATQRISSFPSFSVDSPWAPLETFDKIPIFFEHSLEDKEKSKLVIIEPFFRVKKVQKGFWGWIQKIFGENKEKKKGPGPLIGPIKIPGLGDHVYIRAVEPIENESERIVIHLNTNKNELGSQGKEIKLASPSSFGSSFGSFDTLHELPNESTSIQTIYSPHFSSGELGNLFDKSHLSASHPSWSIFPSPPVSFPSETKDILSTPSFFRKHSSEAEWPESSGSLLKNAESPQQTAAWAPSYGSGSLYGIYGNTESNHDQQGLFASKSNQQVSSAYEDIEKVQGVHNGQLEISQEKKSLPLYPPLFNGSLGLSNSNAMEQLYVTNGRGNQNSGSPSRYSAHHPGLSAYSTQSEMIISANTNSSDEKLEEKYINHDGIREVEAPNLYQGENREIYQYNKEHVDERENFEQTKSDTSNVENSKKVRIFQFSDSKNYRVKDFDSRKMNNETREVVKQSCATYPWTYRVSKERDLVPKASKIEEKKEKESIEPSVMKVQVQTQSESRKAILQRNRSRFTVDGDLKKDVRNDSRTRKTSKEDSESKKIENEASVNKNLIGGKLNLETDTSVAISEVDIHESNNNNTKIPEKEEKSIIEHNNCAEEDNPKCTKRKEKSTEEKMKEIITAADLKKFFIEESKRFEDVLKTVEEESKAIKEESKLVEEELKFTKEDSSPVEGSVKEDIKSAKEESKSSKEAKPSQIRKTTTEPTFKADNDKLNEKVFVVTPSNRVTNGTRFDTRRKKSHNEGKEEIRKSNSSIRVEIRRPVIRAPKVSIIDGRFNSRFRNHTDLAKSNSTLKMEIPKTSPPTHISRIYAHNRLNDRLENNLRVSKPEEKAEKEGKPAKVENSEKKQKKSEDTEKSLGAISKEGKQKEQLHMRMSKLFPKARGSKPRNETEVIVTIKEESTIKDNTQKV